MSEPTEIDHLESANAIYHYIYTYVKDLDSDELAEDEKTLFALCYLLEQFFWNIGKLHVNDFRKCNPEMDNLNWVRFAALGETGNSFVIDEVPDIIYEDLKMIEFYKTFKQIYKREKLRLTSDNEKNKDPKKEKITQNNKSNKNSLSTGHPQILSPSEKYEKKYIPKSKPRLKRKRMDEKKDLPLDKTQKYSIHSHSSVWTVRKR